MSKYNRKSPSTKVENLAGGQAFKQTAELELVSILLTSFVKDQAYRSADETVLRLKALVRNCNKEFVAKAGIYARTKFGMRSITHILASELGSAINEEYKTELSKWQSKLDKVKSENREEWIINNSKPSNPEWLKNFYDKIIYRPDDMLEILAYHYSRGEKMSNSMKKGFSRAFDRFDTYSLAKWKN